MQSYFDKQSITIKPPGRWEDLGLRELHNYQELIGFLAWRDIRVRYKQTVLGVAWAVIQPLLTMVVFSIFFGKLGGIPSEGFPYPIFTFCAILPWQLFAYGMTESSNSLVSNQNLITKVYFPRLIIPLATLAVALLDFFVSFGVLICIMAYYRIWPSIAIILLPGFIVLAVVAAFTVGVWLSALNVRYRDVRYTIPFLTQLWLFATPIAYPISIIPEKWLGVYGLNPMVSVVEGFRWAILGKPFPSFAMLGTSVCVTVVLLISGLYYFRKVENTFADII